MNLFKSVLPLFIASLITAGCTSSKGTDYVEVPLSEHEQQSALSHTKPPQYYGFDAYRYGEGIAISGEVRLHRDHMATAKFLTDNIPVIAMRGRSPRMKMNALLDPSSPDTWMEFTTAENFGAVFLGMDEMKIPYRGGYNIGNTRGYAAVVTQLRIDQLFAENCPLYVRMSRNSLGPLERGIEAPSIDAVLGNDFLKQFEYVQYNFKSDVIKFSATHPYQPHEALLMTTAKIVSQPNTGLMVEGAIYGQPIRIVLDFAGDYYFARGDEPPGLTRQISLGDVVYRHVPTVELPIKSSPPRAGRKMLEKYIITVCNNEGVVYFERIPEEKD